MKNTSFKTALFFTFIFFNISFFNISHHEIWSDEAQIWLLAKYSNLSSLWSNIRFDGHPALWHLMVMPLTRLTENPFSMQVLNIIFASGSAFLILRYSPFSFLQKILLISGYFFIFEYTIISRSYALEVFFLLLSCVLFQDSRKNFIKICLVLFLLPQIHAFGLFFSLGFIGLFLILNDKGFFSTKIFLSGITIIIIGWGLSLLQIIPDSDYGISKGLHFFPLSNIGKAITTLFKSYIPIPDFSFHFWDTHLIMNKFIKALFTLVFLAIITLYYRNKPKLLIFFWALNLIMWSFFYTKHYGSIRHHGHVFLIFIICQWLYPYIPSTSLTISKSLKTIFSVFFYCILSLHAVAGAYAVYRENVHAFSMSRELCNYLKNKHLEELPIIIEHEYAGAPLCLLLQKPIFYASRNDFGTFLLWDEQGTRKVPRDEVLKKANDFSRLSKKDILVIFSDLPPTAIPEGLTKIAFFENSIVRNENYYVYLLKFQSSPAPNQGSI